MVLYESSAKRQRHEMCECASEFKEALNTLTNRISEALLLYTLIRSCFGFGVTT